MTADSITNHILHAKITPPENGRVFHRPALLGKLAGFAAAPRKVWISAPGGAGKTTLVSSFLLEDPRPIVWYHVDRSDQDPANLFSCLSFAAAEAGAGAQPLPRFIPEYLPNLAVYCRNFFRALFKNFEQGCVLVFDDLQDGPGETLFGSVLSAILAELPGTSTLFMLSREEPYPLFARERLNRSLAHLGWDDLRLSVEETRQFLSWSMEGEPLTHTMNCAYDLTHVWLAGLLLFLDTPEEVCLPQGLSFDRTDLLFDYFAGETLARLPSDTRNLLLTCGFLPTVEVSMAERLSGRPDAGGILRSLARENHFTFRVSTLPEVYQFHPLFRQFLVSRANQLIDEQNLADIQLRAASLFLEAGQIEAAAELLIQVGDWSLLVELITNQAETLLKQGRTQTLMQWLKALPEQTGSGNPWLAYWSGRCHLAKNPLLARQEFAKAFEIFDANGNDTGRMRAWGMVVNAIIIGWNDFAELDPWLERFNQMFIRQANYLSPEIESLMVQSICRALIWRQPGNPDLSTWAEQLYRLVTTSTESGIRMLAGSNLTFYHMLSGELVKARSLVALLNSDLHASQVTPLEKLTWLATRGVLECMLLNREGCLATLAYGRAIIEESGVHAMDLRLFGQGITLGLSTGDLTLAAELLDQLTTTPIVTALDQAYSSHLLADFKLLKGEVAEGLVLAELALKRARDGGGPIPIAFCLAGQTLALYQDGQIERAADILQQGLAVSRGMNYYSSLFLLLAAFFAFESGDKPTAMEKLQEGFSLAARQGYLNFHPWRQEIMTRLCSEAIAAGIEIDYVNRLVSAHELDVTPLEVPGLTPKEIEILSWVKEGKTSWEIAKILEISERTVKFHVSNILGKLGVNSRFQAVAVATKVGILARD